jgi:hypothetical protein
MNRLLIPGFLLCAHAAAAQSPALVGRIEGEAFVARGQVSVMQEGGRSVTTLLSGSEVMVTAGYARITLVEGGEIDVCGPAQLSLLKSGGAITLALSHGRVHARVSADLPLQIYTAMVTAIPLSIGEKPRDTVVGLSASGEMCVYAPHGAVRLEHQFSGQRLLVPQLGEVCVPGGQLENLRDAPGACRCDIPALARNEAPLPKPPEPAVRAANDSKPEPEKREEAPVYTAVMPPLVFSADTPAPPPLPSPRLIQLFREVRLQPLRLSGRIERAPPQQAKSQPRPPTTASLDTQQAAQKTGFGSKLKNFFRRLFGRKS